MKCLSTGNAPKVLVGNEVRESWPVESVLINAGYHEIYSYKSWESAKERVDPDVSAVLMIDMAGVGGLRS